MRTPAILLIAIFAIFSFTSCLDIDDPEPDDPVEQMEEFLIGAQYFMSEWLSGDFAMAPLIWTQQLSGVRGGHLQLEIYNVQPANFDDAWKQYYTDMMQRLFLVEYIADQHEAPVYKAISSILQAFAIGMASDAWGDMPLSEVSKFYTLEQNPRYDSQEDIYANLMELLAEGIHLLETQGTHAVRPGRAVDFFYEGSVDQWLRVGRFLQLKFSLRLGHKAGNYEQTHALIQQGGMLSGAEDDMAFPYGSFEGVNNPWYLFDFNIGNIRVGQKLVGLLSETSDPRLPRYVRLTTTNEYVGAAPGSMNLNASRLGNNALSVAHSARRLTLLSYAEQKFIEAEIFFRHGLQSLADEAYHHGVIASLNMHSARNESWEAEHARQENVDLEQIMTAKYLALFLQPEVWTDWRRTGYPLLLAATGNLNDDRIPRRFLYPATEAIQNASNMPEGVTINTSVWWDK